MKKRILFVDDEALVLQGILRMLRPMRHTWDIDFAEGGEKAKECLAQAEYDLVITDMMMPGMDGAQLLGYVREHSPKTARVVLSGHAEQYLAMKCVGIAHQYLSKPCDSDTLRKTIARMTDPRFAIQNAPVMALVSRLEHLPSIPTSYSKIVQLLHDPEASMEDVGAWIASDMAVTAKILQIVNSSFFGLARPVTKPAEAASYLGLDTLKSLFLATTVFSQFESRMPAGFSAGAESAHSQQVGAAARAIAQAEDASRSVVEESLLGGMLHDVGKLVLASSLPEQFERSAAREALTALDAEREVFGATHAEVGGYLLGLWGLPVQVVEAISLHHSPGESQSSEFAPLTAVHVADCLVRGSSSTTNSALDTEYLARIGLAERVPAWRSAVDEILCSPSNRN